MNRPRTTALALLLKWARQRFDRIDRHHAQLAQDLRIYLENIMAQIDDLNAATAKLTQAVADLPGRVNPNPEPAPDLAPVTAAVNAAADAINAFGQPTPPAA